MEAASPSCLHPRVSAVPHLRNKATSPQTLARGSCHCSTGHSGREQGPDVRGPLILAGSAQPPEAPAVDA